MAKDVNLSSQEWLDIVFDGKNKDFGAYVLRANTVRRNNKAVIIVVSILALIFIGLILAVNGVFSPAEEDANAGVDQQQTGIYDGEEEEQEEEQIDIPEEQKPEELPKEEIVNSIQNTEIVVTKDEDVKNEVKNQEELFEDNRQMGSVDQDKGIDDATREHMTKEVAVEAPKPAPEPAPVKKDDDQIYNTSNVQQQPQFPGGDAAMYQWISSHINYPASAAEEGIDGRVTVQFMVDKDGSIKNVTVVKGKHPALDKEAKRVVQAMPKWNPGRNNGQPVKVTYILPVNFKLQK